MLQNVALPMFMSIAGLRCIAVNGDLEMVWKECVFDFTRYHPGMYLEGLRKSTKISLRILCVSAKIRNKHPSSRIRVYNCINLPCPESCLSVFVPLLPVALTLEHRASVKRFVTLQFLILVGRTSWTGNQPIARALPAHKHRINADIHALNGI
jgi:hypothetical protein